MVAPDVGASMDEPMISIQPGRVTRALVGLAVILIALSVSGQILKAVTGHDVAMGFIPLFDLNGEANAPTFFSQFLLLFAGLLLGRVAWSKSRTGGQFARHWMVLAGVFAFLSVDEAAGIHELLIEPLRDSLGLGGVLYYAWVLPYTIGVIVLGLFILPLLKQLPPIILKLFLLSAALYVGGAIGVELLGGQHAERYGDQTVVFSILTTIEESMEIGGVIVFIHALLLHVRSCCPTLRLHLEGTPDRGGLIPDS